MMIFNDYKQATQSYTMISKKIQERVLDKKQNHDTIEDDRFLHITNVYEAYNTTIISHKHRTREIHY